MTYEECETALYVLMHEEEKWFERWERILGTLWTKSDLETVKGGEENEPTDFAETEQMRFPLATIINTKLISEIRERFKGGTDTKAHKPGMPHVPKNAIPMADLSPEDFKKKLGQTTLRDALTDHQGPRTPKATGFKETTPYRIGGNR